MGKNRITFFGWTDYSVASLELIISDLKEEYLLPTGSVIKRLEELKKEVKENSDRLEDSHGIIYYINYWGALFRNFEDDFRRLSNETPNGIEERHIDIINNLWERSSYEIKHSRLSFKREHINKELKDESLRPLLDEICGLTSDLLANTRNLYSLNKRLKTFVGSKRNRQETIIQDDKKKLQEVIPFRTSPGITWQNITIRFLSSKAVSIIAGKEREGKEFSEIGLTDFRTNKPNILCLTLVTFGKFKEISWDVPGIDLRINKNLKKHIYRLNKLLMHIFQIKNERPFKYCSRTKTYSPNLKVELVDDEIYDDIYDDFPKLAYPKKIEN